MLFGDDVIDLKWQKGKALRKMAILAVASGAATHELAKMVVHAGFPPAFRRNRALLEPSTSSTPRGGRAGDIPPGPALPPAPGFLDGLFPPAHSAAIGQHPPIRFEER